MRKEENKKRLRVAGNKKGNIRDRERERTYPQAHGR